MKTTKISSIIPKFLTRQNRQIKKVEIPENIDLSVRNKLIDKQDMLDYMANHFGVSFDFEDRSLDCAASLICKKGARTNVSSNINAADDDATISNKIKRAVSRLLRTENSTDVTGVAVPKGLSDELREKFMSCKGTFDYYTKKHDVNFSFSCGENFVFISCSKNGKSSHTVVDQDDSDKDAFLKIKQVVNNVK